MMSSAAARISHISALPAAPARSVAVRRGPLAVRAASTRLPPPSPPAPQKSSNADVLAIATTLGLTGATIGTYLDGIHGRVQLLIYDKLPLVHGGLHTSGIVPPLLAAYYLVLGGLFFKADDWLLDAGDQDTQAAYERCNLGTMCLSFGALAAILFLSSVLHHNGVSPDTIGLAVAGCAAVNYLAFDSTKQGLALALLCAVVCPASELMLMHIFQLWHYPEANMLTEIPHSGIISWVPLCYFAYTPAVAQLTRYLKKTA